MKTKLIDLGCYFLASILALFMCFGAMLFIACQSIYALGATLCFLIVELIHCIFWFVNPIAAWITIFRKF